MKFNELSLSNEVNRAIVDCGYTEATYIQSACIPVVMNGGDVIGQSQTGTGKTAAFGIPIVEMIEITDKKRPQALILSPTRELCIQVCEEIRKFAKYKEGVRTVAIYGGTPISQQIIDLKRGADIVVGTPGRVLDHIRRKTLRFNELKVFVLDEADEMLNMGFREDIETVIESIPEKRQTVLFSATMPKAILDITSLYQTNPVHIKTPASQMTVSAIEQVYYECNQGSKKEVMLQLIQMLNPNLAMVFCNTKKMVDDLTSELVSRGYPAAAIHGDMKQEMRSAVMEKFKARKITILVATDVAARGIDVDDMDVVFNYDFPQEIEYYVHRIGRTGRAGKNGLAVTFITPRQRNILKDLERMTKAKLAKRELPTSADVQKVRFEQIKLELEGLIAKVTPDQIKQLLVEVTQDGYDYQQIAEAFAYKMIGEEIFKEVRKPTDSRLKVTHHGFTKIQLDVGNRQDVAAAHIVSAIAEASGINGKEIGKIRINETTTTVEIPRQFDREIIKAIEEGTIKGYKIHVSVVKNDDRDSSERPRSDRPRSDRPRSESDRGSRNFPKRDRDGARSKSSTPRVRHNHNED